MKTLPPPCVHAARTLARRRDLTTTIAYRREIQMRPNDNQTIPNKNYF